jgi:hypothetical protein
MSQLNSGLMGSVIQWDSSSVLASAYGVYSDCVAKSTTASCSTGASSRCASVANTFGQAMVAITNGQYTYTAFTSACINSTYLIGNNFYAYDVYRW